MPKLCAYDYAVIRVVPRVDREEFINVGVMVSCLAHNFLAAELAVDEKRLVAFAPKLDLSSVQAHLAALPTICAGGADAGPIGKLPQRERFHWLCAPRSTMIQVSAIHTGLCEDPKVTLKALLSKLVHTL